MICGELSHTFLFQQGGPAQVWHVWSAYFHTVFVLYSLTVPMQVTTALQMHSNVT
jgi:hypothetical protein